MDDEKIHAEQTGTLFYRDNGRARDYGRFGVVVNSLKKQPWFMDKVTTWTLCDSDDSDDHDDFNEENLLAHYGQNMLCIS